MSISWGVQPSLDRLSESRGDADGLRRLWAEPDTRLVLVGPRGEVPRPPAPLGVPVSELGEDWDEQRDVLLGRSDGVVWFARRGEVPEGVTLLQQDFDPTQVELVTAATAVLAWHDAARFCERCGSPTRMVHGGFQRECTDCGHELFPRTDPAMIVAVLDEQDRLLLAHHTGWPEGRVSILAGFLEAGESAEHAVSREVREESGLAVSAVRFLASQPWPYPRSLMLGFVARATGEVRVDGQEIEWGKWYAPEELTAAQAEGLALPGTGSIAGRIIQAWREGRLPRP